MVDPKDEDGPNSTWLDAGSEEVQVMVAPLVVGVDEGGDVEGGWGVD